MRPEALAFEEFVGLSVIEVDKRLSFHLNAKSRVSIPIL
jgi:hypothetical protein